MTVEKFEEMLREQGGVCAICKRVDPDHMLAIDHDHACCPSKRSCGACVRGLLCGACNRALGLFDDDSARLIAAAEYCANRGGAR
jgi:hypothetical protein